MGEVKLKDIKVILPSKDESRAASLLWWDRIGYANIDQWPQELHDLSVRTQMIQFPMEHIEQLFEGAPEKYFSQFAKQVDDLIGWHYKFVRLSSRSPKDGCWPADVPLTCSGKQAIMFLAYSERALDDLVRFSHIPEHPPYLCVRDQIYGISTHTEFRCFVIDGKIAAVTHYDYTKPVESPQDGGKEIRERIEGWFAEKLCKALPRATIVFDVHLPYDGDPLLIEINPYGMSDPCHFKTYNNVEKANSWVQWREPD